MHFSDLPGTRPPQGTSSLSAQPIGRRRDLTPGKEHARGQSVVEFALVLPVIVFLMLAIVDFSRIYTTMLTIESAAREAADFGTFGSQKWNAAIVSLPVDGTEAKMVLRACTASSDLPDYVGPDDNCTNPSLSYALSGDKGATWVTYRPDQPYNDALGCDDATLEPPCWLRVTLRYDFHVITPLNIQFLDFKLGLPSTVTFERSSIFAMTDLALP
jgi:hypothetical protein